MTGGRTIVLGKTGRNFAAGMSGGYAYVLDEHGEFEKCVNLGMVELEALSPEDAAFVTALIEEHRDRTGSQRAAALLSDWENTLNRMVKVVPLEYRRVLAEMQSEKGRTPPGPKLPVVHAGK
jgi:glutamate synthase domain-containing protein 3